MKNPESKIFENITIDQIYEAVVRTGQGNEIKPEQFADLYGEAKVREDLEYVQRREREFAQSMTPEQGRVLKLATIFESIFHEQAELSDWLGPNATTIKASRFDDIKNGVDSIAEFRESETAASYLAMAIDVTMSRDVIKKLERIKKEIEQGKLATVKYFTSQHTKNIRGELSGIPRVVIGVDARTIMELGELRVDKDNHALAAHPVQFQILEEIVSELALFGRYAARVKQPSLAAEYEKMYKLVRGILLEKSKTAAPRRSSKRDEIFRALQTHLVNILGI